MEHDKSQTTVPLPENMDRVDCGATFGKFFNMCFILCLARLMGRNVGELLETLRRAASELTADDEVILAR